eukprot:2574535-Amphidinium_carterae.1
MQLREGIYEKTAIAGAQSPLRKYLQETAGSMKILRQAYNQRHLLHLQGMVQDAAHTFNGNCGLSLAIGGLSDNPVYFSARVALSTLKF